MKNEQISETTQDTDRKPKSKLIPIRHFINDKVIKPKFIPALTNEGVKKCDK